MLREKKLGAIREQLNRHTCYKYIIGRRCVCQHCGAKQGEFFVYAEINKRIQQMEKLEIVGEVEY